MSTSAPARAGRCVSGDGAQKTNAGGPSFKLELLGSTPALVTILVAINLACFYPSLLGYLLADDFVHLGYVVDVFKGNSDVLLKNFISTWMQAQGIQFYRPFYTLTLAFDYLVGGPNSFVFHLSNLMFHTGACLFLFLLTRRLVREYGRLQSTLAGFFAGAIFAVFPLSAEVISWISARGDSLSAMFYLAAFWLFVRSIQQRSRWPLALSLASCAASLLSKEMAVTLAATLTLYCLITAPSGTPWHQRLRWVLARTWLFWMVTGGYLVLRTVALGTIAGGYSGSIGEGLSTSIFKRWFLDGSFLRVLLPFNAEIFSARNWLRTALVALYAAGAVSLTIGLARRSVTKYALFAAAWFVISMLPTYQVWNLTENLQGSRFIYLGTAPLALLLVLLVFPFAKAGFELRRGRRLAMLFATCILAGFLVCFAAIAYRNNLVWVEAGSQVRSLKQEIESAFARLKPDQQLVVLNLPQAHHGAHMLYNGAMLSGLLTPPMSRQNLASRVVTFEPVLYGNSELIISSRLRRFAAQPDKYAFATFDQPRSRLIPVKLESSDADVKFETASIVRGFGDRELTPGIAHIPGHRSVTASANALVISDPREPTCVASPVLALPSLATDFVDVELSCRPTGAGGSSLATAPVFLLKWTSDRSPSLSSAPSLAMALDPDGRVHRYRFAVSQHKKWVSSGRIHHLALVFLPGCYSATLESVHLSNGTAEIPILEPDATTLEADPTGVNRISGVAALSYDVSQVKGSSSAVVELSQPNSFFEHYSGEFRDTTLSPHALKRFNLMPLKGRFEINPGEFPGAGYYQLRVAGISANGKIAGYVSDPINLQVTTAQITGSRSAQKEAEADHAR